MSKTPDKRVEAILNLAVVDTFIRKKHDELFSQYDLTMSQFNVLRILKGVYPDGHPRCEIITRMIDPSPDITRLIDRLITKKLVKRVKGKEDARMSVAVITPKGIELLDELNKKVSALTNKLFESISEKECETLSNICEKIYSEQN
ncbi:MAG TPA: MarR family transcriptional regulator [Ignavibacteria bacterium]|nr:MarR family transcriptional regulator [Ignavibacteria bacterium]